MNTQDVHNRIAKGLSVYTADGLNVGTVVDANVGYIVVSDGAVFATDTFIPTSAVAHANGTRAELNVSSADLLSSGWDRGQVIPG